MEEQDLLETDFGNEKLVTLATFTQAYEAHLLAGKLEAEGIPAFVADELFVTIDPLASNAIGGIRVQIPENRVEDALRLYREIKLAPEETKRLPEFIERDGNRWQLVNGVCLECDSHAVYIRRFGFFKAIGMIFVALNTYIAATKTYYCSSCGCEWKA